MIRQPPDISVVMSVYNNAETLPAALNSILTQEGVTLEFIVMNDGSTDGSAAILDEAARQDSRLRIVHQENTGLTRALITGCALATAPWIARQDADDISLLGRLKAQLNRALQADKPIMVGCGAECRAPGQEFMFSVLPPTGPDEFRKRILCDGQNIGPHGSLFCSRHAYEAVGGYRPQFYYAQDLDLRMRLAAHGRVVSIPEVLYAYTFSPDSISAHAIKRQVEFRRLIQAASAARSRGKADETYLAQAEQLSQAIHADKDLPQQYFAGNYFIGACLLRNNPRQAVPYLRQALACRPWSLRALLRLSQAVWRRRHFMPI